MMGFLIVAVLIYSWLYVNPQAISSAIRSNPTAEVSSGLALLVNYLIVLTNSFLDFTLSVWEVKNHAVSIERARKYLEAVDGVKLRTSMSNRILSKIEDNFRKPPLNC